MVSACELLQHTRAHAMHHLQRKHDAEQLHPRLCAGRRGRLPQEDRRKEVELGLREAQLEFEQTCQVLRVRVAMPQGTWLITQLETASIGSMWSQAEGSGAASTSCERS